eukprot:4840876-Amphidinium_carterae.1
MAIAIWAQDADLPSRQLLSNLAQQRRPGSEPRCVPSQQFENGKGTIRDQKNKGKDEVAPALKFWLRPEQMRVGSPSRQEGIGATAQPQNIAAAEGKPSLKIALEIALGIRKGTGMFWKSWVLTMEQSAAKNALCVPVELDQQVCVGADEVPSLEPSVLPHSHHQVWLLTYNAYIADMVTWPRECEASSCQRTEASSRDLWTD